MNQTTTRTKPDSRRRAARRRRKGGKNVQKSWIRRHGVTIILVLILLVGVGLLLYPTVSNYWNSLHQSRAIMTYAEHVADMDDEDYDKILNAAKAYNEKLAETGVLWTMTEEEKAEYESQLRIDDSGIMGYIQIPKIGIELPIYHGTDDAVLQTSIGHIAGSSLPVGGESAHSMLSGHRGLPSARLFTDLDKLEEGDTFTLTVLNETFTYEVDQIRVVEPTDLSDLSIEDQKDYCTLITCTPYGINTHRLLVRGHRIPNENGDARVTAGALIIRPIYVVPFLMALILAVLLLITGINRARRRMGTDRKSLYLKAKGLAPAENRRQEIDSLIDFIREKNDNNV